MNESFDYNLLSSNKQSNNQRIVLSDELREKNWDFNQTKMSSNLNELIDMIINKKRSTSSLNKSKTEINLEKESDEDHCKSPAKKMNLDENSSTAEFRNYLEDLKKSYLEKLTLSCPSKLSNSYNFETKRKLNENKNLNASLRSSENINNLIPNIKPVIENKNWRRSLVFDINKNDSLIMDESNKQFDSNHAKSNINLSSKRENLTEKKALMLPPDLTKTQMLSRLVQIREYLKQAYTMLATLQTSNDLANYASQINKMHSLIDNLKDQEKGYMDLLESFHQLTSITSVNTCNKDVDSDSNNNQKDELDLTALNESYSNPTKKSTKSLNDSKTTSGYSTLAINKSINTNDDLSTNSNDSNSFMSGSFISDTLTLNCNANQNDAIVKYNKNNASFTKMNAENSFDDDKTDNDQDDDDDNDEKGNTYENQKDLKEKQMNIRVQRKKIFNELNNDLTTLEQLREQKQLLRSIRLRKEELKALEGRRKALEALKKIAVDSENEIDQAFTSLSPAKPNEDNNKLRKNQSSNNDLKELEEFNSYLTMLKEKNDLDSLNEPKLLEKNNTYKTYEELNLNANETEKIDPSYQLEKSKRMLEHFEELMNKSTNNDENKETNHQHSNDNKQLVKYYDEYEHKKELNERLASLAENEKKLEELYAMQDRLSQLKEVINHFNGLKDDNIEEKKYDSNLRIDNNNIKQEIIDKNNQKELEEELLIEHKEKLSNAKEKLKQLQDLISRLQLLSNTPNKENKIEKEGEVDDSEIRKLKELEELKQNKLKLIGLLKEKENESAKLAKVYISLKQSNESNSDMKLSRNSSLMSRNEDENDEDTLVNENASKILNDLEDKFELAENDFDDDMVSLENAKTNNATSYKHSPSDYLWLEMKKQLNMRENLRNKKKELEDLINNENKKTNSLVMNSYLMSNNNKDDDDEYDYDDYKTETESGENRNENEADKNEEDDEKDYFEEGNNNDIINGYREFFLRTKSNNCNKQEKIKDDQNEESNEKISPRFRQKQENVCPPDELIKEEIAKQNQHADEIFNNIYLMKNDDDITDKIEGVLISSFPEPSAKRDASNLSLNNLTEKMEKFISDQQRLNESMMINFQEFLIKQQSQFQRQNESSNINRNLGSENNNNDQVQFQTQIQIQQLMFNLNAAYHEISTQRNEMAVLKENMKQMNSKIDQLSSSSSSPSHNNNNNNLNNNISSLSKQNEKSFNSIGIATDFYLFNDGQDQKNDAKDDGYHPRSRSVSTNNALPSYFYNKNNSSKIANSNQSAPISAHNNLAKNTNTSSQIIQSKHETYYTDDFEEDDDEKRSNYNNNYVNTNRNTLNVTRTFSNVSTQNSSPKKYSPLTCSNRSSSTSSASSSSIKNLSEYSSDSSKFALRKNINKNSNLTNSMILAKAKSNDLFNRINKLQQQQYQNRKLLNLSSRASTSSPDSIGFDKMREKIYSEVATLISKNEKRPIWLLNVFKELQYLNDKNSRDQALKSIFNISNRKLSNAGSFSSSINSNKQNTNENNANASKYDDDDDIITYNYRTRKAANEDDDNSSSQNPFENDSLSNTVIFVKNSPNNTAKSLQNKSPRIIITQESIENKKHNNNDNHNDEKASINNEVKNLISKIISTIKFSNDFDEENSSDDDNYGYQREENRIKKKAFKYKCDSNYLNNIIERVLSVLKQSTRHYDYLRLYQNQLMSYLREALSKYENKNLNSCMEDILIDISDILYNELTFYSIMNNSKLIKKNIETTTTDQSSQSLNDINSNEDIMLNKLNLIKSLARNRNEISSENDTRSNSVTTTTTNDEDIFSSTGEKVYYFDNIEENTSDEKSLKASEMISKNAKASLELLNRFKYLFKERNFNYLKSFKDDEESSNYIKSSDNENMNRDDDSSTTSDKDEEEQQTNNDECVDSVTLKVLDINDLKSDHDDDVTKLLSEKQNQNEITLDDLPVKLDIDRLNGLKNSDENDIQQEMNNPYLSNLSSIIMNSISDDLAGNPEELPDLTMTKNDEVVVESVKDEKLNLSSDFCGDEKSDEVRSQKSDSSNSDHFVIINNNNNNNNNSGGASDQEIVDIKKEIEETEKQTELDEKENDFKINRKNKSSN